ncbi:hypothetical protein B0E50_00710 [Rhodanobacter sp. C01]|nr:hypothetical protein B0E50_00710 [Rhodanobacter sp. C01]
MKHALRLIFGSALLLALAACRAPTDDHTKQANAPMELRIYAVPPEQTPNLADALGNALGKMANVTMPAPGKLLVYAPHDAQASISTAIASLGEASPADQKSAQVNLQFWIVDGATGPGSDDAALQPLSTTLDTVRKAMGPLHFRLDQTLAAMASAGQDGSIRASTDAGYARNIDFTVHAVNDNNINLWVRYGDDSGYGLTMLKTQIDAESGHYVVLAQAPGACIPALPGKPVQPCPEKPALRLFIVRADRLPPHA